jgi:uncharacterized protein
MKSYSQEFWIDSRLEARPSPIQGQGGFALSSIAADEIVVIIGGSLMTEAEFQRFKTQADRYDAVQIDEDLHLVDVSGALQRVKVSLNHSCDSNLWMADENTLVARRDIAPGEEVTVDYVLFTAQPTWRLDEECRCGSPLCRHIISGIDWRLPTVQERYRDHFSPFINRRIAAVKRTNRVKAI